MTLVCCCYSTFRARHVAPLWRCYRDSFPTAQTPNKRATADVERYFSFPLGVELFPPTGTELLHSRACLAVTAALGGCRYSLKCALEWKPRTRHPSCRLARYGLTSYGHSRRPRTRPPRSGLRLFEKRGLFDVDSAKRRRTCRRRKPKTTSTRV